MTTDMGSAPDSLDRGVRVRGGGRGGRGERGAWRPSGGQEALWRVVCAEAAGAALLVLLSCVPACTEPPAELLQRALAAGLVVALLVQCLDHISGAQLNPTVTLAAALWGRVGWGRAACMAGAQLCGAACGAVALAALLPGGASAAGACNTVPAAGLGAARAAALEGALGGCLALANCAAWDPRNAQLRDSWPLRIGTAVAAMSLVASELTGASMNPARSLGPALVTGRWGQHWVYWVGPLGGSALCTTFYCFAWRPPAPRPPPLAPHAAHMHAVIVKSHHSI